MPGFGRIFAPDERDRKYRAVRLLPETITSDLRTTWRFKLPTLDQGDTGTCVGHAWKHFLKCAPMQTTKGLSALEIYDACTKIDEWTDNDNDVNRQFGTSVRAGAEVLTREGRLKSYVWAFTLTEASTFVLSQDNGGPMVLGTNWYHGMMQPTPEGFVKIGGSIAGGHAYLLRGIDVKKGTAKFMNSWGDWAKRGEFFMSLEDLERLISEDGEACSAIEQKISPKVL